MVQKAITRNQALPRGGRLTSLVWTFFRPYRGWLLLVVSAIAVDVSSWLAMPWPLKMVLDNAIGTRRMPSWLDWVQHYGIGLHAMDTALVAAIATVLIALVSAAALFTHSYYAGCIGEWVGNDLRIRLYEHLHRLSLHYYSRTQSAVLVSTLTNDVAAVQEFVTITTFVSIIDLFSIVIMLILMWVLDFNFTLIALGVLPFIFMFFVHFSESLRSANRLVRDRQTEVLGLAEQGLTFVRTVAAFGRSRRELARMRIASHATVESALKARRMRSLITPVVSIVVAVFTAIILWKGTSLILAGQMTVGDLTVFLSYLAIFFQPVKDLAGMTGNLAQARVALERIDQILSSQDAIREPKNAAPLSSVKGAVSFERVAFSYDKDTPVLKDVSFSVEPGQVLGVVGPTGSGKTTVLGLIPRLYDPDSGRVLIDGIDVRTVKLAALRAQIGFVLQETVLFQGTIRDNIAYGKPRAHFDEIVTAAKLANAHEFIVHMPEGYDSVVGERGESLSGGQRQRIGIARAAIRNCPIMILDEPTAALDSESENLVIEGLERLMKGRTVIMVAHRLSTLRNADKIIVLKDGVVAEEGTIDDLLALGGVYASLYHSQYDTSPVASN